MKELPVVYDSGVELSLGTASLEEIRSKALHNIELNPELSYRQKKSVIKELDFLIEHERLRRLRKFAYQWAEEREAFRSGMLLRKTELENSIRLSRKQTALQIAQLNKDIWNCRLDVIERIKQMRPKKESPSHAQKAIQELQRLRLQQLIMSVKENMFHENLTNRTLNRQKFFDRVKKLYPDMADEMMEYYDRQVFQQSASR